jgi:pimeloyl-ACP methyl ester carboxylesterase
VRSGEVELAVRETGPADGRPVVLLHGLATNREYVLMRSSKLERSGYRVIAYDARGHGRSSPPAGSDAYEYDLLLGDLLAVMDARQVERALLVGVSMGAHTALKAALEVPERAHALVAITPAYGVDRDLHRKSIASADRLAAALRSDGIEGFVSTFEYPPASENLTEAFRTAQRRQLSQHASLDSVADALEVVMRAKPYGLDDLARVQAPTLIVASHDEYDTEHPYATAERYVQVIPSARLVCEDPGRKPLAWNGGALAKHVLALAEETGW